MHDAVTSQAPKCFMVSETVSPTVINNLVVARQTAVLGAAAVSVTRCVRKMQAWTAAHYGRCLSGAIRHMLFD